MENCFLSGWPDENAAWITSSQAAEEYYCSIPQDEGLVLMADKCKASSASRSHSEAEKRRRDRINAQLATLRKLIPKSEKMDKAALLGSVIEQVKDLKSKAIEVSKVVTVPTDFDEVIIMDNLKEADKEDAGSTSRNENSDNNNNVLIKVSFCCDDRPELFGELNRALQGLKLTIVEADLSSLAGRIRSKFSLCAMDGSREQRVCMKTLKDSLKLVLTRIVMSSTSSNSGIKSKRQRFFMPSSE